MVRLRFETKKYAEIRNISVQPYIITVGDDNNLEAYVCVDETLYKVANTITAIDICFKAFHVFNVKYPGASEHLWTLIQKGIYGFTTKWDTNIPFIAHVLKQVQNATKLQEEATITVANSTEISEQV